MSTMKDSLPSVPQGICADGPNSRISDDVTRLISAQQFLLERDLWRSKGRDPRFLREAATQLLGRDVDPFTHKLGERSVADLIIEVNRYFHSENRTRGARSFRSRVIQAQDGEFCALCGSRSTNQLQVDHVVPVNIGGQDHLSNMQLLCTDCNSAKGNWRSLGVGAILQSSSSDGVPKLLRYKKLLESSSTSTGRTIGQCRCGRTAKIAPLDIEKIRPLFAPTYLNLRVTCKSHR
jgi:5-methylcytosine-specific restriction endonuclease McrA